MARLREHRWIRQERAYARVKQNLATLYPDEYLSIAIDGYLFLLLFFFRLLQACVHQV
jgi:hypothetical protein